MTEIKATGKVTTIEMSRESIRYTVEGTVGKYGYVHFTHQLEPTHGKRDQGSMQGYGRTYLEDGRSVEGDLQGVWRRTGSVYKVYSLDDGSNGDINFVDIDVDLVSKEVSLSLTHLA